MRGRTVCPTPSDSRSPVTCSRHLPRATATGHECADRLGVPRVSCREDSAAELRARLQKRPARPPRGAERGFLLERDQKLSGGRRFATRVRFVDICSRAQPLEHDLNRGDVHHRFADFAQVLIILAQASIAGVPSQRSLHDPAPRLDDESLLIRVLPHDLQIDLEELMDESDEVSAIRVIRPDFQ
jgi:hypothetical protein